MLDDAGRLYLWTSEDDMFERVGALVSGQRSHLE